MTEPIRKKHPLVKFFTNAEAPACAYAATQQAATYRDCPPEEQRT